MISRNCSYMMEVGPYLDVDFVWLTFNCISATWFAEKSCCLKLLDLLLTYASSIHCSCGNRMELGPSFVLLVTYKYTNTIVF